MVSKFLIYGLQSTKTGELRYVGRSCSGLKRPKMHLRPAVQQSSSLHVHRWARKETSEGFTPQIVVLEATVSMLALKEAEEFYIAYFRSIGARLTNTRLTSQGRDYGYRRSPETRAKMSISNTGRTYPGKSVVAPKRAITFNGRSFESVSEAARLTGTPRRTLCRWLKNKTHGAVYEPKTF